MVETVVNDLALLKLQETLNYNNPRYKFQTLPLFRERYHANGVTLGACGLGEIDTLRNTARLSQGILREGNQSLCL